MRLLLILSMVCLLLSAKVLWAQEAEWLLESGEIDGKTSYTWVKEEVRVEAVRSELAARISGKTKLFEEKGIAHRVLLVPRFSLAGADGITGGAILLIPGESAESLLKLGSEGEELSEPPSDIAPHNKGFFFTLPIGSVLAVGSYDIKTQTTTIFARPLVSHVRTKETTILMNRYEASIDTKQSVATFGPDGKKRQASLQFHDFTSANESTLLNEFKAIDLVQSASLGQLESHDSDADYLARLVKAFTGRGSKSALLVSSREGVEAEGIVNLLAHRLSQGELNELKGWRLFEVDWKVLGTEGNVNMTVDKVARLFDTCRQKKVILYFSNIDQLKGLGVNRTTDSNDASGSMVRDMELGRVVVLGMTSERGSSLLKNTGGGFYSAFAPIEVVPPTGDRLIKIVTESAENAENAFRLHFSPRINERIVALTNQFIADREEAQPGKSRAAIYDIAGNPEAYLNEAEQAAFAQWDPDNDPPFEVTDAMVRKWLAERTGISTLAESDGSKGLNAFIAKDQYWPIMDKAIVGSPKAKQVVLDALSNLADLESFQEDAGGGELGLQTMLFLGPSGTGKSHIPKSLSKQLKKFGVEWEWLPIEMSKATGDDAVNSFKGAAPGYVGFREEGSAFVQLLQNRKQAIIVFEEIDKMSRTVMNSLYDFLDDGRFQDSNLNEVRWTRGMVFMTANFGAQSASRKIVNGQEVVETGTSDMIDDWDRWHLFKKEPRDPAVKAWSESQLKANLINALIDSGAVSAQVIGRIGTERIVILHHFTYEEIKRLSDDMTGGLVKLFPEIKLEFTPELKQWLVDTAWGPNGDNAFNIGARAVENLIKDSIQPRISESRRDAKRSKIETAGKTFVVDVQVDKILGSELTVVVTMKPE